MVALALLITACLSVFRPKANLEAYELIPQLENLTSAVSAELENPFRTNQLNGDQLLAAVFDQKPALRQRLSGYRLALTNNAKNAIILLSPKNQAIAWLEDATWSQNVDRFHFLSNPQPPLVFTISLP